MYIIKEVPIEGWLIIDSVHYGRQIWTLSKMTKKHKSDACAICQEIVGDKAYRPITNQSNRMKRICTHHAPKK